MSLSPVSSRRADQLRGYKQIIDKDGQGTDNRVESCFFPETSLFLKHSKDKKKKVPAERVSPRRGNNGAGHHNGAGTKHRLEADHRPGKNGADSATPSSRDKALLASDFDAHVILRAVRDKQGRITDFLFAEANDKACADNKLTREQLVGHRLLKVFPNARRTGLFDIYVRALETDRTVELKGFDYPHDILGGNRKFDIRAVPVGDELAYTWREVTGPPLALERRKNPDWSADADQLVREFQSLARNLLKLREEEQHVVSRELHDNIAQVLSAVTTRISLAKDEKIPAWLRQELLDMREQLQGALADVRTLARELRPSVFDHAGFAAALEKHAEAFRERTRMTLEVRIIPESVNFLGNGDLTHLFRLTQEALQNIEEHSGADNAWINLLERDGAAHLEIGDDGCAFTPERVVEAQRDGHLGLLGMRERAELIGGRFVLEAVPGEGTVINVIIPPRQDNRAANTPEYEL